MKRVLMIVYAEVREDLSPRVSSAHDLERGTKYGQMGMGMMGGGMM